MHFNGRLLCPAIDFGLGWGVPDIKVTGDYLITIEVRFKKQSDNQFESWRQAWDSHTCENWDEVIVSGGTKHYFRSTIGDNGWVKSSVSMNCEELAEIISQAIQCNRYRNISASHPFQIALLRAMLKQFNLSHLIPDFELYIFKNLVLGVGK